MSGQLHYSWTDELSVCRFPLGVVSIAAPLDSGSPKNEAQYQGEAVRQSRRSF